MVFCSYDCSSRYEQTTSQILHQSVTPTGTQLQLAGLDDNLAYAQYQQDNATPVAVNPFKRGNDSGNVCSQNHHQPAAVQQAPIQVKPLVANPYQTGAEHSPFRPITPPKLTNSGNSGNNNFPPPPKFSLTQQNVQQNVQNFQNLSLQNLNHEFQQNLNINSSKLQNQTQNQTQNQPQNQPQPQDKPQDQLYMEP